MLVPEFFWQIPINLGLAVVLAVVQVVASIPVPPGHDAVSSVGSLYIWSFFWVLLGLPYMLFFDNVLVADWSAMETHF